MEKVGHKSSKRKEMATLKWVSTRSPVKGTRAKLATDTKEESSPFTLYCSHQDFQAGNFIWNIIFNSHSWAYLTFLIYFELTHLFDLHNVPWVLLFNYVLHEKVLPLVCFKAAAL